ncbi:hypothetical protein M422DRAFT_24972 [Sphaerobolus stellatus SS14]|nr:hypothetical protein M422DRAFT_24972 [Sphaerobolus stellatus SS14]
MSSSQKNYESAFASLQSSFGFSGTAPCMPSLSKSKSSATSSSRNTSPTAAPQRSCTSTSSKNYESAFGQLQATYGFGGASFSGTYRR